MRVVKDRRDYENLLTITIGINTNKFCKSNLLLEYIKIGRVLSGKRLFVFILLYYLYSFVDSKILLCVFNSLNVGLGIVYFYEEYIFRKASVKYFILACVLYVLIMTFWFTVFNVCLVRAGKGGLHFEFSLLQSGSYILWFVFKNFRISLFEYFGERSM